MYKEKTILALIPARGASKGLARKNVRPLFDKPLIGWTIEEAKKSRYIDRVIVSTDDKEIADISQSYGAEVPFLRPKELATDEAKGIEVVMHAIDWSVANGDTPELLILLQPTSPLRSAQDIDEAIELLFSREAKAIVSVYRMKHPPAWSNTLPEDGCMKDFISRDLASKNRQDSDAYYILNGAIYLGYINYIKKMTGFFGEETFAYIMPQERSVDIDDEADFLFAESLLSKGPHRFYRHS